MRSQEHRGLGNSSRRLFSYGLNVRVLLLLLLSHLRRVRLCATPETAAHQAPRPWDSPGKSIGWGAIAFSILGLYPS